LSEGNSTGRVKSGTSHCQDQYAGEDANEGFPFSVGEPEEVTQTVEERMNMRKLVTDVKEGRQR